MKKNDSGKKKFVVDLWKLAGWLMVAGGIAFLRYGSYTGSSFFLQFLCSAVPFVLIGGGFVCLAIAGSPKGKR